MLTGFNFYSSRWILAFKHNHLGLKSPLMGHLAHLLAATQGRSHYFS